MELPAASHQDWSRRLAQPVPVDMRRELLAHSAFLPFPNVARKDLPPCPHSHRAADQQNTMLSPARASRTTHGQSLTGPEGHLV